jgi:hypothetical protein
MEPERVAGSMRRIVLTALWGQNLTTSPVALGTLTTAGGTFTRLNDATAPGVMILRVELEPGADDALLPATVVAIRNDRASPRAADSRVSRYADAMYVYLPEVLLSGTQRLELYVGADGTTIYGRRAAPHLQPPAPGDTAPPITPGGVFTPTLDRTLVARAALGQCFPLRRLVNSFEPSPLADLHRAAGLRLADEPLFKSAARKFLIQARVYADPPQDLALVGQLPTYNDNDPNPVKRLVQFSYKPEPGAYVPEGARLLLRISRAPASTDAYFPMTDLIVTDRAGRALLVALPEMDFAQFAAPVWLFFDTDGATYYASTDFGHDTALARPERGGALRFDPADPGSGLARRSGGQVLALPGAVPCRHRVPIAANLCYADHPKPLPPRVGQVAVDPVRGRFHFASGEVPAPPADGGALGVTVDYHEGFAADVGALTYDRSASLESPELSPTRFVAQNGDAARGNAPVHATLAQALSAARDRDVIQIEDSATYDHAADLVVPPAVRRLVIQAANRQRPCLRFANGAALRITGELDVLRLNGLLISGAEPELAAADPNRQIGFIEIARAGLVKQVELIACTLAPSSLSRGLSLVARDVGPPAPTAQVSLCRCIVGGLRLSRGVAELVASDSIVDGAGGVALGDTIGGEAGCVAHLERATVWGAVAVRQLYASECLIVDRAVVGDRQAGCVRFSRYQPGSSLPRRFRCVPPDDVAGADAVSPAFNSHRFGRPGYAQLHLACPDAIRSGAEDGAEMGAMHEGLASLREKNLLFKVDEYLPVGLTPALSFVT